METPTQRRTRQRNERQAAVTARSETPRVKHAVENKQRVALGMEPKVAAKGKEPSAKPKAQAPKKDGLFKRAAEKVTGKKDK